MSTRAFIIEKTTNGTSRGIYCHHDGYISGVGRTLNKYYRDPFVVSALIALGGLSSLGQSLGSKVDFETYSGNEQCVAYHRDRGEDLVITNYMGGSQDDEEYTYMYDHSTQKWYIKKGSGRSKNWVLLDSIIEKDPFG